MEQKIRDFMTEWIRASDESVIKSVVDHEILRGLWEQFAYDREEEVAEYRDLFLRIAREMWRERGGFSPRCETCKYEVFASWLEPCATCGSKEV